MNPDPVPDTVSRPPPLPAKGSALTLPRPWLLADIGGTNARFGWLAQGQMQANHVSTLRAADHPSPAAAARSYLAALAETLGPIYAPPGAAAFAVATAVGGDHIALTNSGWAFSRSQTRVELQLAELLILNDFEALALSLPGLRAHQVSPIPSTSVAQSVAAPGAALAVIGPGTGLGVSGLVPTRHGWAAIPGEGGHATLSAADDFESDLLAAVRAEFPHVSAERLLSGIGLPTLHRGVAAVLGQTAPTMTAGEIVDGALSGKDVVCGRTVDVFSALLGSFAGNVALVLGARGGVYVGGGIVPRLGDRFFQSSFRQRFEAKGRFESYLQAIPTYLITDTLAALGGAALALEQHET
jgi:glucokinase